MRVKSIALFGAVVAGAAGLLAGSQTWVSFMLDGTHSLETVTGHDVNAALTPVFIAIMAAALALTIAGPVFRRVLGVLVTLLGAGAVALSMVVLANPLAALAGKITELTGISGSSNTSVVTWSSVSGWGYLSVVAGVLALVIGLVVLVTAGRWAAAGRKYAAPAAGGQTAGASGGAPDRISDWDALSDGGDPTDID